MEQRVGLNVTFSTLRSSYDSNFILMVVINQRKLKRQKYLVGQTGHGGAVILQQFFQRQNIACSIHNVKCAQISNLETCNTTLTLRLQTEYNNQRTRNAPTAYRLMVILKIKFRRNDVMFVNKSFTFVALKIFIRS